MSKEPVGLSHDIKDLRKGRTAAIGLHGCYGIFGEILSNRKGVVSIGTETDNVEEIKVDEICEFWTCFDNCGELYAFKQHWDKYECSSNW